MTNGDRIRSMDDLELAKLLYCILSERDHLCLRKLQEAGVDADLYEVPELGIMKHLNWLQSEEE